MTVIRLKDWIEWPASGRNIPVALLVFALLAFWIAPTGIWGDNEQVYLWSAKQWVGSPDVPSDSALMGKMVHAYAFHSIAGALLNAFGEGLGQALLRILSAAFYAYAIARLASSLGLRALEAGLLVVVFILVGQELFAGEWMFRGVEPKVLAYPCLLIALSDLIRRSYFRGVLWLVAASHFHLILGATWFAFMFATALFEERRVRPLIVPAMAYVAGVLPFLLVVYLTYHTKDVTIEDATPPPAWILSFIRYPHHSSPWNDRFLLAAWLPGIAALVAIVACAYPMSRVMQNGASRWIARLIVVCGIYLCFAIVVGYFDHSGEFVSLTPFRANSLLLFLSVALLLTVLRDVAGEHRAMLVVPIFVTLGAIYLTTAVIEQIGRPIFSERKQTQRLSAMWQFARDNTPKNSIFLADPAMDRDVWSFERRTGRGLLVVTKFIPTDSRDISEWYIREQFRASVFANGCKAYRRYEVDYLLVKPHDVARFSACGSLVFADDNVAIVRFN